jgi:RNA polymerase sigma-70 factor (ECF subfamily)
MASIRQPMPALDGESAAWIAALSATGGERDTAMTRLHELLVRVARRETQRRGVPSLIAGPELDDLAHQAAADAMLAIVGKLDSFRGESRFTTWAYAFVVFEVSSKIARHFWRRPAAPLDEADWDRLPDRFGFDPAEESQWRELMGAVRRAVEEELTAHQRRVFAALVLDGVPLDVLVLELRTNRNAVYKALFDARRKVRAALAANGYLDDEARRS